MDDFIYLGVMSKTLFRSGAELLALMFSNAGVFRITSIFSGSVPGFWRERGLVCNFIKKSLSYCFLPSLLAKNYNDYNYELNHFFNVFGFSKHN